MRHLGGFRGYFNAEYLNRLRVNVWPSNCKNSGNKHKCTVSWVCRAGGRATEDEDRKYKNRMDQQIGGNKWIFKTINHQTIEIRTKKNIGRNRKRQFCFKITYEKYGFYRLRWKPYIDSFSSKILNSSGILGPQIKTKDTIKYGGDERKWGAEKRQFNSISIKRDISLEIGTAIWKYWLKLDSRNNLYTKPEKINITPASKKDGIGIRCIT